MVINKDAILTRYAENLPENGNQSLYLSYAGNFLEHAESLDRPAVEKYLKKLERKGRSAGTRNFAFRVIRRMFMVNGLDWPFKRGEAPQISQRDEYKPQLPPEYVEMMIAAALAGKLDEAEACFLALATVYGLRREEMCALEKKDVDLRNGAIYVSTVKHGRQRYHLLPEEIKNYLATHDFGKRYSRTQMSQLFWRVLNKAGLEALQENRMGWHSVRRSLLTALVEAGINIFSIRAFMRWKGIVAEASELAMPARYFGNTLVTIEGKKSVTQEAKGDEVIFESHPFLAMWRGKLNGKEQEL